MEKGNIVKINDGSYNRVISKELAFENETAIAVGDELFEVFQVEILMHSKSSMGVYQELDIMLKALTDGRFVFTQERFLRLHHACNTCPSCGKSI